MTELTSTPKPSVASLPIQENISLQAYNTLSIAVLARWLVEVKDQEQLLAALTFVKQQQCPLLVLGGGSNVVLANDFSGLVILLKTQGMHIEDETAQDLLLSIAAGENWHDTVMYSVQQGWSGLENLALIPGSVGAAPIQNIGAYGVELVNCFEYLEGIDIATGEITRLNKSDCEFSYRESVFKHRLKDQFIITRVVLRLSKSPKHCLSYPALRDYFADIDHSLSSQDIAEAVMAIRQSKLPDPKDIPNAGSFFKNPIVDMAVFQALKKQFPDLIAYPQGDYYKLAAGWLIDHAGWKGKMVDGACMHAQQALVLTNPNGLSGMALLQFVQKIQADIQQKYGITLTIEPRVYQ